MTYTHLPHLLPQTHLVLFSLLGRIGICVILGLEGSLSTTMTWLIPKLLMSLLCCLSNVPLRPISIHDVWVAFCRVLLQSLARSGYRYFSCPSRTTASSDELVVGGGPIQTAELFISWSYLLSEISSPF